MIIELESAIQQATSVDELKPLMRLMVKALNTLNDARSHVRGTLIFHDKGPVLRCDDGNYYLLTVKLSSGVPAIVLTSIGSNPTGE